MMKEIYLQRLKPLFPETPDEVLEKVAEHLSQTAKADQMEEAIKGVQPLVTSFEKLLKKESYGSKKSND